MAGEPVPDGVGVKHVGGDREEPLLFAPRGVRRLLWGEADLVARPELAEP